MSYFADPEEWFFLLRVGDVWRAMIPARPRSGRRTSCPTPASSGACSVFAGPALRVGTARCTRSTRGSPEGIAGARVSRRRRGAPQQSARRHGHERRHPRRVQARGMLVRVRAARREERELDRYERQRRPIALEYVNTISIANKRNLETRDPGGAAALARGAVARRGRSGACARVPAQDVDDREPAKGGCARMIFRSGVEESLDRLCF